jgi:hypothetical protein
MSPSIVGAEETLVGWFLIILVTVHLLKVLLVELVDLIKKLLE